MTVAIPAKPGAREHQDSETMCMCEPCKAKRFHPHTMKWAVIHSYNYSPRQYRMLRSKNDTFPYHIGVELETSRKSYESHITIDGSLAADLRRPKTMWYVKHDGSVDGPEFVSHPATLTYWHEQAPNIQKMFDLLVHAGYRSHNGGAAGMHVNIGIEAFEDEAHTHRFLVFLYTNWRWALTMSMRTEDQASQWAGNRPYTFSQVYDMRNRNGRGSHKYSVVHKPRGSRWEFRLPRGTLRLDRFMKNIEWTAAMVAYTRLMDVDPDDKVVSRHKMHPYQFVSWVASYPTTYAYLLAYLQEKNDELEAASRIDDQYRQTMFADCDWPMEHSPVFGPPLGVRRRNWWDDTSRFGGTPEPYFVYDAEGHVVQEGQEGRY